MPSDFAFQATNTSVDGVVRVGAGIDIYATSNIVSEFNFAYVLPFTELRSMKTDYVAIQWRLIYRF